LSNRHFKYETVISIIGGENVKLLTSLFVRAAMLVANISVLALVTQPAAARVWVFGDSNVDTGWYKVSLRSD
jgi:hypothetical protein